ncbi:MAG: tetratricopeptide repeat protein [Acidobacteriota bacterium]
MIPSLAMIHSRLLFLILLAVIFSSSGVKLYAQAKQRSLLSSTSEDQSVPAPPRGKSVAYYLARGGRFLETGDYLQAIAYLDAALRAPRKGIKPAIIQLAETLRKSAEIYQQAHVARKSGQAEAAVEKYREIMQINPTDPRPLEFIVEVYDLLSEAAEKRKDYQEAARLYEAWLKYAPKNDFPRKGLIQNLKAAAEAATANGDRATAVNLYRKLVNIDPTNKAAADAVFTFEKELTISTAEAQLAHGDIDSAITSLNSALSLYPNESRLLEALRLARGRRDYQKAEALMAAHQYHEAVNFYQKALAILPSEKSAIEQRLAEIRLRTGANYRSNGTLRVRGQLSGPAHITISGNKIVVLNGNENVSCRVTGGSFPDCPFEVKLHRLGGDVIAKVVTSPSRSNNYTLGLQLTPKNERDFGFEIEWERLKTGSVNWHGYVKGRTLIRLQGPFVDQQGSVEKATAYYDPLPHERYSLTVIKLQATDQVSAQVIERPSAANDYAAVIEVTTSGAEEIELKIDWVIDQ